MVMAVPRAFLTLMAAALLSELPSSVFVRCFFHDVLPVRLSACEDWWPDMAALDLVIAVELAPGNGWALDPRAGAWTLSWPL